MADELLEAVRRIISDHEQHDRSHEAKLTAAVDQLTLCALQVRAMVQTLDTPGIADRAQLIGHAVKLCIDLAAMALHIASRVQR